MSAVLLLEEQEKNGPVDYLEWFVQNLRYLYVCFVFVFPVLC